MIRKYDLAVCNKKPPDSRLSIPQCRSKASMISIILLQLADLLPKTSGHSALFAFQGYIMIAHEFELNRPLWGLKIGKLNDDELPWNEEIGGKNENENYTRAKTWPRLEPWPFQFAWYGLGWLYKSPCWSVCRSVGLSVRRFGCPSVHPTLLFYFLDFWAF